MLVWSLQSWRKREAQSLFSRKATTCRAPGRLRAGVAPMRRWPACSKEGQTGSDKVPVSARGCCIAEMRLHGCS